MAGQSPNLPTAGPISFGPGVRSVRPVPRTDVAKRDRDDAKRDRDEAKRHHEEPSRGSVGESTAIVSRSDSIESVKVLRQKGGPVGASAEAELLDHEAAEGAKTVEDADVQAMGATETTEALEVSAAEGSMAVEASAAEGFMTVEGSEAEGSEAVEVAEATDAPSGYRAEDGGHRDVQGLFARIRASRTEATTVARKALYEDAEPGAQAKPMPEEAPADADTSRANEVAAGTIPSGEGTDNGQSRAREFFLRRDQTTSHLESSLARKLKRALQDEQNSILDRLRNLKGPAAPTTVLPNVEEHPDRFMDAGRPLLEEAAQAGSESMAAFFGGAGKTASVGHEDVDDLVEELGRSIAEPLRQRLELAFEAANEDHAELADALGSAYREWKTQRIEETAHDQVAAAFARGAYVALPEGALLRWVAHSSGTLCPDCEDNALAGEQVRGEPWPTGQLHPPAHPGCRCALAPALRPVPSSIGAPDTTGAR
jgi:hypothetical protein